MRRLLLIALVTACGGPANDLPFCGDGFLDPGETCDDGNNAAGDGCSATCTSELCGNNRIDQNEQCDDGNRVAGDGCSATCTSETQCGNGMINSGETCDDGNTKPGDGCSDTCTTEAQYAITATWQIKNLAGTAQPCPGGFDTATVVSQLVDSAGNNVGNPILDLFTCADGSGTTASLYEGSYKVWIAIQNTSGSSTYATSVTAAMSLHSNQSLTAQILTDGGYFALTWNLVAASNSSALTCAQAGATSADVVSTISGGSTAFDDLFTCTDGQGVTSGLAAGTYTVSIAALNSSDQSIGTAPALTNKQIQAPNVVTNLGTIMIPIQGF